MEYEQYERLIMKIAHQFATSKEDFEDLKSVGNLAFMRAVKNYDGKKKFSSFLYICVKNAILSELKNRKPDYGCGVDFKEIANIASDSPNQEQRYFFYESIKLLSEETQAVIDTIFSAPMSVLWDAKNLSRKSLQGAVSRFLRRNGYSQPTIENAKIEIKDWLNGENMTDAKHQTE